MPAPGPWPHLLDTGTDGTPGFYPVGGGGAVGHATSSTQ